MTIEYAEPTESIFDANTDAYICPVNTEGVMGKGLAKEFKRIFPRASGGYIAYCKRGELAAGGTVWVTDRDKKGNRIMVYFLATKDEWRNPSQLEWVKSGLAEVAQNVKSLNAIPTAFVSPRSIAIPALGCGLGGLDWGDVQPLIEEAFAGLPELRVVVYPPKEGR